MVDITKDLVNFKLEDLVSISTGKIDSNESDDSGSYPFFTCAPEPLRINWYAFEEDAILLAGNNANGVYHLHRFKGKFNAYQRTYVLTVQNSEVSLDYLYYFLLLRLNFLKDVSQGTATKFLTKRILNNISVQLPSKQEQDKISKILKSFETKIELNQQMNKTLESIAQILFKHWFIDFEFPDENGQPYKSSGGEMVDSEIGEIPKGWRLSNFSKVIAVNPYRKLSKGEIAKKIAMSDLEPWQSWVTKWNREPYTSGSKYKNGDTLFARITPSLEHGKTALIHILGQEEIGYGSTEFIVFGRKEIKSEVYIFNLCRSDYIRMAAIGSMTGTSGRQRVPNDLFDHLLIVVPPDDLVSQYDETVIQLFRGVFLNASEVTSLIQIRDLLLPKLMSGKLRVPVEDTNV